MEKIRIEVTQPKQPITDNLWNRNETQKAGKPLNFAYSATGGKILIQLI